MAYSDNFNGYAAFKVQSAKGTPASGSGGKVLPLSGGQMGRLQKTAIASRAIRRDGMQLRGRHGSQRTMGGYSGEMLIGGTDDIKEAVMRSTWSAANSVAASGTQLTSVTTTSGGIIAAAGSFIAQGFRVGDVVRLTGFPDVANNNKNRRVSALTTSTMSFADGLIPNATPDTTFQITRVGRTLDNPGAGALLKRYFTIEESELDLNGTEVFSDCVWNRYRVSMGADGNVEEETGWMGTGAFQANSGAAVLTSPTEITGVPLAAVEATLRYGTTDLIDLTSFDLTIEVPAQAPPVTGPQRVAPDVFLGVQRVSMNLTVMRKDLLPIADFLAENQLSLHFLAAAQGSEPLDFFSAFVGNFTLGDVAKSALSQDAGGRTVQLSVPAELVGIDGRGGAYAPGQVRLQVSNAT